MAWSSNIARCLGGLAFCAIAGVIPVIQATSAPPPGIVSYIDPSDGQAVWLDDNRQPALYSTEFGDCLGGSLLDITRFDTAYYQDNMTIAFRLEGSSLVGNESLMLYISVFAYGKNRFQKTFDPCGANIFSLCPTNTSEPVVANFPIAVSPSDVAAIPSIALGIPDFEGQSILRVFSNNTQSEIGCYSARITNGNSFSHPDAVGSILGIFTVVAVVASFATAAYGTHLPTMRTHFAHSLSVFVVFGVWHHIFFTGALSVDWPSVLPAFWSNYAWTAGMISTKSMQASINSFVGPGTGNPTAIGGAATLGASSDGTAGGYRISQIYQRAGERIFGRAPLRLQDVLDSMASNATQSALGKRDDLPSVASGFDWYGTTVSPGLPLPGNFSGFAGTLSYEDIPASNAFLTGFLWLLILILIVVGLVVLVKLILEVLARGHLIAQDRLDFFREHWLTYATMAIWRTLFIAFFMIIFLALFQFVYRGPVGITVIAVLAFLVFFFGMLGCASLACYSRYRHGTFSVVQDRLHFQRGRVLRYLPWFSVKLESKRSEKSTPRHSFGSLPWWKIAYASSNSELEAVHEDEPFLMKYGWLSARFRTSRWWFFAAWLCYEFVRACFYGGAAGYPKVQVFGLLCVEFLALVAIVRAKPFEGARLNLLMVYLLGFSKIATLALSSAFDKAFALDRVTTAAIGIVIIVIQGLLTIALFMAIIAGAVTSYMSLTRNRESFAPASWAPRRDRYFAHLARAADDRPRTPPPPPEEPKAPYFTVASIRRLPKIEDEDADEGTIDTIASHRASQMSFTPYPAHSDSTSPVHASTPLARHSRAESMRSNPSSANLPFGARPPHRASWSSRDFMSFEAAGARDSHHARSGLLDFGADGGDREGYGVTPVRSRAQSRANSMPLEVAKTRFERGALAEEDEGGVKGKGKEGEPLLS